jgi:hypothetical protein
VGDFFVPVTRFVLILDAFHRAWQSLFGGSALGSVTGFAWVA